MKFLFRHTLLPLAGIMAFSSCIRDEIGQCPNLSMVLEIKDRAYANAAEVNFSDDHGDAAFSKLIPTLHYVLRDFNTGEVVCSIPVSQISGEGLNHNIQFDGNLPFGKYTITAWGALDDNVRLSADSQTLDLTDIDTDVYVQTGVLDYNYDKATFQGWLERVNGLVIVETKWETFPAGINASEKTFTNLERQVNNALEYSDNQDIKVDYSFTTSTETESRTVLPPSVSENGTVMKIRYYDSSKTNDPGIVPDDIPLTVRRNEVTRLQLSFDPYAKSVVIKSMVNGQWQQTYDMGLD